MIIAAKLVPLTICVALLSACGHCKVPVLYDASCPVIYDNDEVMDTYTDEYAMALASLGEIQLKGMISSSPLWPETRFLNATYYETMVSNRQKVVAAARASGFQHIPDPVRGPNEALRKPESGRIEDTRPIGSQGSRLIVEEARKASKEKPLVIVIGGGLTAEADAYLLDPSIADKVVVAWLADRRHDMAGYNGWLDGWADYIVLQKLRLVQFDTVPVPRVLKSELYDLPPSPLRDFMYNKVLFSDPLAPAGVDADAPPVIAVRRPEYILRTRAVSFGHWMKTRDPRDPPVTDHDVPTFRRNVLIGAWYRLFGLNDWGRTTIVRQADEKIATEEWWRAVRTALRN
jgi:hypothetical protein